MLYCRKGLIAFLVLGFVLLIFPPHAFSALSTLPDTPSVTNTDLPGDSLSSGQDLTSALNTGDSALGLSSYGGYNNSGNNDEDGHHHHKPPPCPPPVPIPNAAWLLGSGVVALFVLKRRRPKT
jgi:hypothetical protein